MYSMPVTIIHLYLYFLALHFLNLIIHYTLIYTESQSPVAHVLICLIPQFPFNDGWP